MNGRKKGVRSVKKGTQLRHTTSKNHNANEISRWEKITGHKPSCCVNQKSKIPKGPNKGKNIGGCKGRYVGAHVKFGNSRKLFIVPVCNGHNDTGHNSGIFRPGDWFIAKNTKAVSATNSRLPKIKSQQQKKRPRKRRRGICKNQVSGWGRCRHHKYKRRGKRVRKGICGAKIRK